VFGHQLLTYIINEFIQNWFVLLWC
jgi:hypothetical protein